MAPSAIAAQSAPNALGTGAAHLQSLVAQAPYLSPLSAAPPRRYHLRQERDAVGPLVRIRGGGREQSRSLLRLPVIEARASLLAPPYNCHQRGASLYFSVGTDLKRP